MKGKIMARGEVTGVVSTTFLRAGESVIVEITDQIRELEQGGYVRVQEYGAKRRPVKRARRKPRKRAE